MGDYDPSRTGKDLEIFKTESIPLPKKWQREGFTEGKAWVTVKLEENRYVVEVNAKSPQNTEPEEGQPSEFLGLFPTTRFFDNEADAKKFAQELIADSENWDDERYN